MEPFQVVNVCEGHDHYGIRLALSITRWPDIPWNVNAVAIGKDQIAVGAQETHLGCVTADEVPAVLQLLCEEPDEMGTRYAQASNRVAATTATRRPGSVR